ncbi:hypothetical protein cyc_06193 [Cyclospora cayetanensis]|uniref:Uncharacterized protein n=1 Tax=Cyclospora cayetanensis TaxID=88456 RepID=A0A1D3D651_9EIME|nr:hypothetical protein cyc_06193 [Cyclospora cayetanensis]
MLNGPIMGLMFGLSVWEHEGVDTQPGGSQHSFGAVYVELLCCRSLQDRSGSTVRELAGSEFTSINDIWGRSIQGILSYYNLEALCYIQVVLEASNLSFFTEAYFTRASITLAGGFISTGVVTPNTFRARSMVFKDIVPLRLLAYENPRLLCPTANLPPLTGTVAGAAL